MPANKRFRLTSIARCRKRPLDDLESYVRSVRHAEERLRQDLREAERDLAQEKDYSCKVKRERDDLRKEVKEIKEGQARQQEKTRDLKAEVNTLQKKLEEANKAGALRDAETKKRITADLQRGVEKHLRTLMLELDATFKASCLVFDPEVTSESDSEQQKPDADEKDAEKPQAESEPSVCSVCGPVVE